MRVQCVKCRKKNAIIRKMKKEERKEIWYPECQIGKKKL